MCARNFIDYGYQARLFHVSRYSSTSMLAPKRINRYKITLGGSPSRLFHAPVAGESSVTDV